MLNERCKCTMSHMRRNNQSVIHSCRVCSFHENGGETDSILIWKICVKNNIKIKRTCQINCKLERINDSTSSWFGVFDFLLCFWFYCGILEFSVASLIYYYNWFTAVLLLVCLFYSSLCCVFDLFLCFCFVKMFCIFEPFIHVAYIRVVKKST